MSKKGMRYVAIYRCSSNVQTEKSIPDQQKIVQDFARTSGLIHAGGDIIQAGVSASTGRKRDDIELLIERKIHLDDFEIILVHDFSRLTRRGPKDGSRIEGRLEEAGIRVLSATEQIPDGTFGDIIRSFYYTQANEYVKGNAHRTARGQMSTIMAGKSVGPRPPTYGIDRLYLAKSGEKRHRIRGMMDGSQIKLHADTEEVLTVYEKGPDGKSHFYRKQADEDVRLVPGDPKQVAVVRSIYHMAIVEGLGYYAIAKKLDAEGKAAPLGGRWHKAAVQRILKNPVYTGRLIFNRLSSALYWKRSPDGPIPVVPNLKKSRDAQTTAFYRPIAEWVRVAVPETAGILDPSILERAIPFQDRLLEYDANVRGTTGIGRDKYPTSSFFLKDVLTLKEDGSPMCGQVADQMKNKQKMYRYYRPRGYGDLRHVGTQHMCRIPAGPLEALVKDVLCRVFEAFPNTRDLVKAAVVREQSLRHEEKTRTNELKEQRAKLKKKIACFADFGGEIDDEWVAKVGGMKERLRDLDLKIQSAESETAEGNPEEIADAVVREMAAIGEDMPATTLITLRKILLVLVEKMEVDLFTREVWLKLRLPSWALMAKDAFTLNKVCSESHSWQSSLPKANFGSPQKLPVIPETGREKLPGLPGQPTPALDGDGVLLADVRAWCIFDHKHTKGATKLSNWRFEAHGGILDLEGPQTVNPPSMPTIDAAAVIKPQLVQKKKPSDYEWFNSLPPLVVPPVAFPTSDFGGVSAGHADAA